MSARSDNPLSSLFQLSKRTRRHMAALTYPSQVAMGRITNEMLGQTLEPSRRELFGEQPDSLMDSVDPELLQTVGFFFLAASKAEALLGYLVRELKEDENPEHGLGSQSGSALVEALEKASESATLHSDLRQRITDAINLYKDLVPMRNHIAHGIFLAMPRNPDLKKGKLTMELSFVPMQVSKRATKNEVRNGEKTDIIKPISIDDLRDLGEQFESLFIEVQDIRDYIVT